jgi:CheY-like chemotaxis protein
MLDRSLGSYTTLVIDMPTTLPLVRADATQLEMALLNLALNARDAMPNGGPITITARPESFQPGNQLGLAPGLYVGLSVRDKGIGMDAETMKRSIEPFFTTKGVGKGTGLGLAMVHGLAEQLDGRLQLASSLGSGTTATLWLPLVREPENATASAAPPVQAGGRKLRVLAVDDDGLVLLNTVMSLEEEGHAVRSAYSGTEALAMLEAEPFDLLVTDQGMPGMTGIELMAAVRGRLPGLPIVLVTGYAELPRDLSLDVPVVSKPFRGEQLSDAIRVAVSNAESIGKSVAP